MAALSNRRNMSVGSQVTMVTQAGRRQPFFVLDDQAAEDQFLFTSLRYDAKEKCSKLNPVCCKEAKHVYLFRYHFDRLKDSANARGWYDAQKCLKRPIDLYNRVSNAVCVYEQKNRTKGPYKVRINLRYHGNIQIDVSPDMSPYKKPLLYPTTLELFKHAHPAAERSELYKVVLDALPTQKSLHTKSKTEWRSMYDYARVSAGLESYQDAKEVLLFNADGEVMDCSITTPYFYRNGGWVTPHTSCGGQMGTTRRWAVDQGLCKMGTIHVESLRHDEVIWLSNSVKGFFTARFIASPNRCQGPGFRSKSTSTSSSVTTAVDTPTSEKSKSMLSLFPTAEIAWTAEPEELSPQCTQGESPTSPVKTPVDFDAHLDRKLTSTKSISYLNPIKSAGKISFRMPQFFGGSSPNASEANMSFSPREEPLSPTTCNPRSSVIPQAAYEIL